MYRYSLLLRTFFVICVAAVIAVSCVSCSKKKATLSPMVMMMMQAAPVRAVEAISADVPLSFSAIGNVEAMASVDIKSRVAGQVMRVEFQEGQNVQKGELLFEIDPEPLRRQLAEYQADIGKDMALEAQARANVVRDQAQLKQTKAAADRGMQLSKEGIFSKEQTEQVVATAESSQASLDADKAAVESAEASLKADHAKIAETQLQLDYTKVMAPISGRAGAIAIKAGNLVKDNDVALVTLLQLSPIYVSFGVQEQLLPEIQKNNSARPLEVKATGDGENASTGRLRFIDNMVDNTTGTIKLKAEFENPQHTLWPGQFVNVRAQLNVEHGRVLVPSRTVQTGPQGKFVWVMNPGDGTVAMRPVEVSRNYQASQAATEQAVVSKGLQPGEMVISEGQMRLAPGMKVKLLDNVQNKQTQIGSADDSAGGAQGQ